MASPILWYRSIRSAITPFLNETTRPVRRTQAPFPCVFLRLHSSYSSAVPRHFICGAVTTRQSGLHAATHFSFDPNENEWPSRRAAAQFSVLHEQEAKPRNPGFHWLLNVDCSRVLDLAHGAQTLRVVMTSRMTIH